MNTHLPRDSQALTGITASAALLRAVTHCFDCAEACTSCAHACMEAPAAAQLQDCIRVNLECADLCFAAGTLASQPEGASVEQLVDALRCAADACEVCAEVCESQLDEFDSCVAGAQSCRSCRQVLLQAMREAGGAD